jgi:predicted Zn-dependent protease
MACNGVETALASPAIPAGSCDGPGRRVCIVPVGRVSADLLFAVVERVKGLVPDAPIAIAPAVVASGMELSREQMSDTAILGNVQKVYNRMFQDPNVVLIAITPIDMYSAADPQNHFVFGVRRGPFEDGGGLGVMSYWRMDDANYGKIPDAELLEERLSKLVLKYVLTLHLKLPDTSDPTSLTYNRLYSLDALDRVKLAVPGR